MAYANKTKLESSIFADNDIILGYSNDEVDVEKLNVWQTRELTSAEALAFAQKIRFDAFFDGDGTINIVDDVP